jgi:hypothetical protein
MAIPVMTDYYSAQVIFRGLSGVPEDVYTNTFYFRNDNFAGGHETVADQLRDDLEQFYNDPPTTVATPVSILAHYSSQVVSPEVEVRVYDLGQPAPRYPKIRTFTGTIPNTMALPSEVAACLSYVSEENQPRNRGRIYLGPLSQSASELADNRAVVKLNFRHSALASAQRLIDKPTFTWSLWSPTSAQMKQITGLWMDNAYDTQRRRGERATHRYTSGFYQGQSGTEVPYL